MKVKGFVFLLIVLGMCGIGLSVLVGCSEKPLLWYQEVRQLYHGIPVHVGYFPEDSELTARVWAYMDSVDAVINDYKSYSEISAINGLNSIGDVTLSPMLADCFDKAQRMWRLSDGVFDISCAPIRNLWKTAAKEDRMPTDEEVTAVMDKCGFQKTKLVGPRLSISTAGMKFDFGGIIKGMIADHVVTMLKDGGAQSALIQIGGETAAFGLSRRNKPYRIGIQHPAIREETWCVIHDPGTGLSTSTSGNYEQPIMINGEEFYHIMDPRTGRPAKTQIVSVSIAFPKAGLNWMADGLSTTGVILGPEKTFELLKPFGGEAMFLVKQQGELREIRSEGWVQFL